MANSSVIMQLLKWLFDGSNNSTTLEESKPREEIKNDDGEVVGDKAEYKSPEGHKTIVKTKYTSTRKVTMYIKGDNGRKETVENVDAEQYYQVLEEFYEETFEENIVKEEKTEEDEFTEDEEFSDDETTDEFEGEGDVNSSTSIKVSCKRNPELKSDIILTSTCFNCSPILASDAINTVFEDSEFIDSMPVKDEMSFEIIPNEDDSFDVCELAEFKNDTLFEESLFQLIHYHLNLYAKINNIILKSTDVESVIYDFVDFSWLVYTNLTTLIRSFRAKCNYHITTLSTPDIYMDNDFINAIDMVTVPMVKEEYASVLELYRPNMPEEFQTTLNEWIFTARYR